MARIRYECPYPLCGWTHTVNDTTDQVHADRLGTDVVSAHVLRSDKVDLQLATHLDGTHPGWTLAELVGLKEERERRERGL